MHRIHIRITGKVWSEIRRRPARNTWNWMILYAVLFEILFISESIRIWVEVSQINWIWIVVFLALTSIWVLERWNTHVNLRALNEPRVCVRFRECAILLLWDRNRIRRFTISLWRGRYNEIIQYIRTNEPTSIFHIPSEFAPIQQWFQCHFRGNCWRHLHKRGRMNRLWCNRICVHSITVYIDLTIETRLDVISTQKIALKMNNQLLKRTMEIMKE